MPATITHSTATNRTSVPTAALSRTGRALWRTGLAAGAVAAAATAAYTALVDAAGVSLSVGGETIPVAGFAQITFVAALIGTVLAVVLNRRARQPRRTFLRTTIALTVLTFVPDVIADAPTGTRLALAASHVIAAAIVIPALASRLSD